MKYTVPLMISLLCVMHVDMHAGKTKTEKRREQRKRQSLRQQSEQFADQTVENNADNDDDENEQAVAQRTSPAQVPMTTLSSTNSNDGRSDLQSPRGTPTQTTAKILVGATLNTNADTDPRFALKTPGETDSDREITRKSLDIQRAVESNEKDDDMKNIDLGNDKKRRSGCLKGCTIL